LAGAEARANRKIRSYRCCSATGPKRTASTMLQASTVAAKAFCVSFSAAADGFWQSAATDWFSASVPSAKCA
jgi:hypothetical protein